MYLFKGAFRLFRNPASHRPVDYTPERADELLRVVNLCLRILATEEPPAFKIRLPAEKITDESLQQLRGVLQGHAGQAVVHVHVGDEKTALERFGDQIRVDPTEQLRTDIEAIFGDVVVE